MRPSSKIEKEKGRIFQSPSRKCLHSTLVCMPLDNVFSRDNRGLPHFIDEPTAALDALAENEIYERYAEFARGKTSFFVSHRLSSTRFCDRILLLDGGNIAEEGTHEELLAGEGIYAKMFEMQSKYYQGGEGK